MSAMKRMTEAEWRKEGERRFGPDQAEWKFVCPACGHVAAVKDWKEQGAVAYSCVGRWQPDAKNMGVRPGPCSYAGGGLFRLNPVEIVMDDGSSQCLFDFASEEGA